MIDFKDISDYQLNIDEMLKYGNNYFNKEEINKLDYKVVLKDHDVIGVLFNIDNRYMFYKLSEEGYLPFYMEYQDNKTIVNENEYYMLCKGNNFATIVDHEKSREDILSYKDGFVKYIYHDLNNDKLYTFFYKQGELFNNNKKYIAADYFNIPDGFCYQKSPNSILSYGYFKVDVSSSNPIAVLSETDNILEFIKNYDYFRKSGFPDIELYTKIKKKDDVINSNIINFKYKNEENYLKSLNELNVSYNIPKQLVRFYNGSFDIELTLDEIVNSYNNIKNNKVLTRKNS